MRRKIKLICGWGINDADYEVYRLERQPSGVKKIVWICPVYHDWKKMIERCHSEKFKIRNPTYKACTICEDWKHFSVYRKWVLEEQPNKDWMNCYPDKDIIVVDNKVYSPETVVYINRQTNTFTNDHANARGAYMIGVSSKSYTTCSYKASCNNPFYRNKHRYIGTFQTELEAHLAWQAKKHEYACQLADLQDDPRVAKALRERYAPDKDWTNR